MAPRKFLTVLALLALTGLAACSNFESPAPTERRVENVVRLIMRQEGEYTLFVKEPDSKFLLEKQLTIRKSNRQFIADVPPGSNPWILILELPGNKIIRVEFHVRSAADIEGGGYMRQSGKSTFNEHNSVIF